MNEIAKQLIRCGAIGMAISISLGALGAHQLKKVLSPNSFEIFHTGVDYLLYHSLAFLLLASLSQYFSEKVLKSCARLFGLGILLFSGSLFAICFFQTKGIAVPVWLGIMTPVGGLCFIVGWVLVTIGVIKR